MKNSKLQKLPYKPPHASRPGGRVPGVARPGRVIGVARPGRVLGVVLPLVPGPCLPCRVWGIRRGIPIGPGLHGSVWRALPLAAARLAPARLAA